MISAHVSIPRLLIAVTATAPLVVAIVIRTFCISSLPERASAEMDTANNTKKLQPVVLPEFTAMDRQLLDRAQAIASKSFSSPFVDVLATPQHADTSTQVYINQASDTPPELVVSSLLDGGRNTIAMINGEAWRIGQEVAPGWVLVTINARDQYIEIENAQGKRSKVPLIR